MNNKRLESTVFHDVMPAMADVLSESRPRPEALPINSEPDLSGSLAHEKLLQLGSAYVCITPRGSEPSLFVEQTIELRHMQDDDSAILLVDHSYLVACNIDATNLAVVKLSPRLKSRSDEVWMTAQRILHESGTNVSVKVNLQPLARELADSVHCHYDTAKQHIARAVRRKRDPEYVLPIRGGLRDNKGGRPRK